MVAPRSINQSLSLDVFWAWLGAHFNCILRAGGLGFTIFDHPDFHWHLGTDADGLMVVQVIKGKDTAAEFYINPNDVVFVQASPDEGEQTLFECIGGPEGETMPLCHFLLAHPYDEEDEEVSRPLTH